jgi:hypothetical protein
MLKRINYLVMVVLTIALVLLPSCSSNKLSESETKGIKHIYEVEKVARDVYKYFYDKFATPVQNVISGSEQNHMDIMKELIDKYNLGDPAKGLGYGEFSNTELRQLYADLLGRGSTSEIDALSTSAAIEEFDILEIRKNVTNTNGDDLASAYQQLMTGSENHLRIFTAKLKEKAVEYKPQYLTQQEYNQIVGTGTPVTTTTPATTTNTAATTAIVAATTATATFKATYSELAVNGAQTYSSNCINCHGLSLSTGGASSATLAKYQNAQALLQKITTMPINGTQKQWEVLAYLLLEHNWVSGTAIFNPEGLSQIVLSP